MPNSPAYPPELRAVITDVLYDPRRNINFYGPHVADELIDALSAASWNVLLETVAQMGRAYKAGVPWISS